MATKKKKPSKKKPSKKPARKVKARLPKWRLVVEFQYGRLCDDDIDDVVGARSDGGGVSLWDGVRDLEYFFATERQAVAAKKKLKTKFKSKVRVEIFPTNL